MDSVLRSPISPNCFRTLIKRAMHLVSYSKWQWKHFARPSPNNPAWNKPISSLDDEIISLKSFRWNSIQQIGIKSLSEKKLIICDFSLPVKDFHQNRRRQISDREKWVWKLWQKYGSLYPMDIIFMSLYPMLSISNTYIAKKFSEGAG